MWRYCLNGQKEAEMSEKYRVETTTGGVAASKYDKRVEIGLSKEDAVTKAAAMNARCEEWQLKTRYMAVAI